MLKAWHKEDAFNALQARGWMRQALLEYPKDWNYVGEAWSFSRANWIVNLYFVADYGTGFYGTDSVESIAARLIGESGEYDLWLHRTRNAKWKASVTKWADQISADRHVDQIASLSRSLHVHQVLASERSLAESTLSTSGWAAFGAASKLLAAISLARAARISSPCSFDRRNPADATHDRVGTRCAALCPAAFQVSPEAI